MHFYEHVLWMFTQRFRLSQNMIIFMEVMVVDIYYRVYMHAINVYIV